MKEFKKLTRDEMRNVKGASNGGCTVNAPCTAFYFDGHSTITGTGHCDGGCTCIPDAPGFPGSGQCTFGA
jgi:hypothetical protein